MLNVTVNNAVKVYGDPNPDFSFELEGFVNSESADVIDELPQATAEANTASDAGYYSIGVQDGMDNNYEFDISNGVLEITKREIIVKPADISKSFGDQLPEINLEYSGLVNNNTGDEKIPLLITIAIKLIPDEIIVESREKAKQHILNKKKTAWWFAVLVIFFWLAVLLFVVKGIIWD